MVLRVNGDRFATVAACATPSVCWRWARRCGLEILRDGKPLTLDAKGGRVRAGQAEGEASIRRLAEPPSRTSGRIRR